ncbi:MAG: imidazole glycerol phosphate synthase subunit HisF [Methanobrevibacter sp.]|nr:imidazole glycerol phosphate synthase subunit HisF [Methanobrevibacter sp.]MBO7158767.1 imidazole glycerol phosphate synthase subunit HisF [Methanobrevibacter sp.]MBO7241503.1 imidazole glycerol phosphate synthase subunit HisF [Methanobrevibacter sp.]MBO7444677.1 imidazole glycerol phosphate synthase subunit HisF [Methanobrevibacter sp.]MBO7692590.1 imidazole glycerol phosphate synthase subunit HisF [Methanobrevibacter sp.]
MLTKRIIPCLDCDLQVPEGRVVKGVEFKQIRYAGNPVELATKYYEDGADEIVILDITASHERRGTMVDVIERLTENVFIPICVGGGIRKVEDYTRMLKAGADKCSTNTAAIHNPQLLTDASKVVGSQAVVIGIDAKRRYVEEDKEAAKGKTIVDTDQGEVWFDCSIYGGREFTGMDAIAWAQECQDRGAGEVLLTSMDGDGTKDGYDLVLTKAINDNVDIPVIASGGVGNPQHILEAFEIADASAALAASIFHFDEYPVPVVKKFLKEKGVPIRETF